MIIDNQCYAPQIGTWRSSFSELPEPGVVVMGLVWNPQNRLPCCILMEWRVVEEASDYNDDHVFQCRDHNGSHASQQACWFAAFEDTDMEDSERTLVPPLMWADTKWNIKTPFSICEDCDGLKIDNITHDECDDEGPGCDGMGGNR